MWVNLSHSLICIEPSNGMHVTSSSFFTHTFFQHQNQFYFPLRLLVEVVAWNIHGTMEQWPKWNKFTSEQKKKAQRRESALNFWCVLVNLYAWYFSFWSKKNSSILPNLPLYLFIHLQNLWAFWLAVSVTVWLYSIASRLSFVELCDSMSNDFSRLQHIYFLYVNVKIPSLSLSVWKSSITFNGMARPMCGTDSNRCYLSCFSIEMVVSFWSMWHLNLILFLFFYFGYFYAGFLSVALSYYDGFI